MFRRTQWKRRAAALAFLLVTAILVGVACEDEETAKPDDQLPTVPDFALEDINPHSPTYGQIVSVQDFPGQMLLIFYAPVKDSLGRSTFDSLAVIVDQLAQQGVPNVTPIMINPWSSRTELDTLYLRENVTSPFPVLQDVWDEVNEANLVGHMLQLEDYHDFMIADRRHNIWKKVRIGEDGDLDLRDRDDMGMLRRWIQGAY